MSKAIELLEHKIAIHQPFCDNEDYSVGITLKEGKVILAELQAASDSAPTGEKQPEPCKTCGGSKQLLGTVDAPGKSCDGLPMPYPCPNCKPEPTETQLAKALRGTVHMLKTNHPLLKQDETIEIMEQAADELDRQASEIKKLKFEVDRLISHCRSVIKKNKQYKDVIKRCIKAMEGSNCLELKWLEEVLKGE